MVSFAQAKGQEPIHRDAVVVPGGVSTRPHNSVKSSSEQYKHTLSSIKTIQLVLGSRVVTSQYSANSLARVSWPDTART